MKPEFRRCLIVATAAVPVLLLTAAVQNPSVASTASAEGRIEGAYETVHIASPANGEIASIDVTEGQAVTAGQVLARLSCRDLEQDYAAAQFARKAAEDGYQRARHGARQEERDVAAARVAAAEATLRDVDHQNARTQQLYESGHVVSAAAADTMASQADAARATLDEARRNRDLVNATLLPEDDSQWQDRIGQLRAQEAAAQNRLDKCSIRAPAVGVVLRVFKHAGEVVSNVFPEPILDLSDPHALNVRTEVDERDIGEVVAGQRVDVVTDYGAGGTQKLGSGHVISMAAEMGRKQIQGPDPADRSDREVRQVLVTLDEPVRPAGTLPIGLRVIVLFNPKQG